MCQLFGKTAEQNPLIECKRTLKRGRKKEAETVSLVSHPALIEALLSDSQTLPEQEHVVFLCQNLQGLRSWKRNCSRRRIFSKIIFLCNDILYRVYVK